MHTIKKFKEGDYYQIGMVWQSVLFEITKANYVLVLKALKSD